MRQMAPTPLDQSCTGREEQCASLLCGRGEGACRDVTTVITLQSVSQFLSRRPSVAAVITGPQKHAMVKEARFYLGLSNMINFTACV